MHELIKYISDILNIKTDSVYTIQDMTEELSNIKDIAAYRAYVKDNIDKIDYKTGFQKFIILTRDYLLLEYVALNPRIAGMSLRLTQKVQKTIWGVMYDNRELWTTWIEKHHELMPQKMSYNFTEEEEEVLKKIGTTKEINRINDDGRLESEIIKAMKEESILPPYKKLSTRLSNMITVKEIQC